MLSEKIVAFGKLRDVRSPEDPVIVQQSGDAAVLLQHNRVTPSSGEKGNSQAPLPAQVPSAKSEGKVGPLPWVQEPVRLLTQHLGLLCAFAVQPSKSCVHTCNACV